MKKRNDAVMTRALNFNGLTTAEARKIGEVIEMNPKDLVDDPDNEKIRGDYDDIDGLAQDIKANGWFGIIAVYPFEGKYRIQSGHRRKYAAIKAGLDKVSCLIVPEPVNDFERRRSLGRSNLHSGNEGPMYWARTVQYLYDTYTDEAASNPLSEYISEAAKWEQISQDTEKSVANLKRYQQLLRLNPELQKMADSGDYAWSTLASASKLDPGQQSVLCQKLKMESKLHPGSSLTRAKLTELIEACEKVHISGSISSPEQYLMNRDPATASSDQEIGTVRLKRSNATVLTKKCVADLAKALDPRLSFIKDNGGSAEMMNNLHKLKKLVDEALAEYEENGFGQEFSRKI